MQTIYRRHVQLVVSFLFLISVFVLSLMFTSRTHAVDYPCGTYSAGEYESDCALEEPAATNNSGTTTSGTSSTGGSNSPTVDSPESIDVTEFPVDAIILNTFEDYSSDIGKRLDVNVEQVIHLTVNSEKHTITVKTITDQYVIVTIASTPTDVKIALGDIVNYDVDKDGSNDIAISYFGPASGVAVMNFRQIAQPAITTTGQVTDDTTAPAATVDGNKWWIWVLIVGGIITITAIVWAIIAKRRKTAAAHAQPFNSQPWQ
jgi:hypothetical protein